MKSQNGKQRKGRKEGERAHYVTTKEGKSLADAGEGRDERGGDGIALLLVKVDDGDGALGDTLAVKLEVVVDLLVRARSSETGEAELLVRVLRPAEHVVGLMGREGSTESANVSF